MGGIADRIESVDDRVAAEIVRRLEAGEPIEDLGGGPAGVLAAIARFALGPDGSAGPTLIRSDPTRPRLALALSDLGLAALIGELSPRPARLALAAGLLQMFDFWDASHAAAQEADDLGDRVSAAYWHLIAHRREPDAGNAHYWARRVGRPSIARALAESARPIVEAWGDANLTDRLSPGGHWNPAGLIDLADRARPGTPVASMARRLQRLEMVALLGASLEAAGVSAD